MKRNLFNLTVLALILLSAACSAGARTTVRRHITAKTTGAPLFLADSIAYRPDLTRLYGRISGQPHTSGRIDSIRISAPAIAPATDIDGVDFKRWFQWEDDGMIPLEIDFPAMRPAAKLTIQVITSRGPAVWIITEK